MSASPSTLAVAFHGAASVTRAALYGTQSDLQLPKYLQADARVPFLGFCGPRYSAGGCVLLAINPGGGGDAYSQRTPQDAELIPLIEKFVAASQANVANDFEKMSRNYAAQAQTWNLWRILGPTIAACRSSIDQVCYLNIFPYRTAKDALPSASALRKAWELIVVPLLGALRPSKLVALGKKAGNVAERFHRPPPRLFVVPRTIGDSYVSAEAEQVLASIRQCAT
jgi:hypothetical protein